MHCRDFERRLAALLGDELPAAERAACARHLALCGACRELAEAAAACEATPIEPPADLVESVLAQTTGPACPAARQRLAARDAATPGDERLLLERHLESCADCRALARALGAFARDLPRLAEVRPDARFVADVLAATLPVEVQLWRWWRRRWRRWAHRPRFAFEVAYAGVVVLVLAVGTPGSPLEALPRQALELASDPRPPVQHTVTAVDKRLAVARSAVEGSAVLVTLERRTAATLEAAKSLWTASCRELRTRWHALASLLAKAGAHRPPPPTRPTEDSQ